MSTITRFEEIDAWQAARQLANLVYDLSDQGRFSNISTSRNHEIGG